MKVSHFIRLKPLQSFVFEAKPVFTTVFWKRGQARGSLEFRPRCAIVGSVPVPYFIQLDQVTFWDTETAPKGQYDVWDDTPAPGGIAQKFSTEHGTNQWQEPNPSATDDLHKQGWTDPICYSSGSTMTAFVQFKVPAGSSSMWSGFTNMKIKGVGLSDPGEADNSAGYNFTNTDGNGYTAVYKSTNNTITANVSGMTCSQVFPSGAVDYFGPMTIQWYISVDGGNTWSLVNKSKDECFVTLNTPNLTPTVTFNDGTTGPDPNYRLFQTVLHYACSNFGATTPDTAVANTWALFSGPQNICAWNPTDKSYDKKLYYYKTGQTSAKPVTTSALLAATDGNGECYAFGQLFQDALWANGVSSSGVVITPKDFPAVSKAFLVKDWTFTEPGTFSTSPPFSYEMLVDSTGDMVPAPSSATTYGTYGDMINLQTHLGQNTAPPSEKLFGNHYIVSYGSTYYDPSYGVTYTSAQDFENKSVAGYAEILATDNPSPSSTIILRVRKSDGLDNILFTPNNQPH